MLEISSQGLSRRYPGTSSRFLPNMAEQNDIHHHLTAGDLPSWVPRIPPAQPPGSCSSSSRKPSKTKTHACMYARMAFPNPAYHLGGESGEACSRAVCRDNKTAGPSPIAREYGLMAPTPLTNPPWMLGRPADPKMRSRCSALLLLLLALELQGAAGRWSQETVKRVPYAHDDSRDPRSDARGA